MKNKRELGLTSGERQALREAYDTIRWFDFYLAWYDQVITDSGKKYSAKDVDIVKSFILDLAKAETFTIVKEEK